MQPGVTVQENDIVQYIGSAIRFKGTGDYSINSFRNVPPGTLFRIVRTKASTKDRSKLLLGLRILKLPSGTKEADYYTMEGYTPPWIKPAGGGTYSEEYFERVDPTAIINLMLARWL